MGHINTVVIISKLYRKCECIVESCVFSLHIVLIVADIVTIPKPSLFLILCLFLRIKERFHTGIIQ